MSDNTYYATSVAEEDSETVAEAYMQFLQARNPKGPVDFTLPDNNLAWGRQTVPAHQGMSGWHVPPHLLKPENDLQRYQIDERLSSGTVRVARAPEMSSAKVWALPGMTIAE
jgi:hypothetical protein